jgi:DNA-binding response OmpR family regulator
LPREKILIIEDEPDILEVVRFNLEQEGFRVLVSRDGNLGFDMARRESPDLVVLDLMLPGMDGLAICRRLKGDPVTGMIRILMLTARSDESDIVVGLELGADDYITKPFGTKELVARVRAILRRGPQREEVQGKPQIHSGGVSIDVERHEVLVDGEPVTCTATELRLLHFLASHPGRVFTREQLINRVIGQHAVVLERNIDVHVRSLRKKLGPHREMIETVRGVGYRFREVKEVPE